MVTIPALVFVLVAFELVIFRYWLPVGDVPVEEYDAAHQLMRYRPNQRGTIYPGEDASHPVHFRVNADGWNSAHERYSVSRGAKLRVAVIGDSYVAAFEVPPERSLAARLESRLGPDAEVYTFGMRGAPLSQYLQMARYVVPTYRPDVLVVVLVHNDFDESYRIALGRYTRSFLHVRPVGNGYEEVPPSDFHEPAVASWIRTRSRTFRFFFYRLRVGSQAIRTLYARLGRREPEKQQPTYEANIETARIDSDADLAEIRGITRYCMHELAKLAASYGVRLVFLMDAPRDAIYAGKDPRTGGVYRLNEIARAQAQAEGATFIDLTPVFVADYAAHGMRFDFPTDGHWNEHGHEVAGATLRAVVTYSPPAASAGAG